VSDDGNNSSDSIVDSVLEDGNTNDLSATAIDMSETNKESTMENQTVSEHVENTGDGNDHMKLEVKIADLLTKFEPDL